MILKTDEGKNMRKKKTLATLLLITTLTLLSACSSVKQEEYDAKVNELTELQDKYNALASKNTRLTSENTKLSAEVTKYEEIIEPYEKLSAAELEEKTQKANLEAKKAEEELKAKEEAEKKAAEEKAAKERAEKEAKEKQGYNTGITYDQLARTPDDYEYEKVKFSGEVIQVVEDESSVTLRLAIDSDYDKVVLLIYDASIVSSRVLEDDYITIYGVSNGVYTYQSTMGGNITVPLITVDKIDQ